jgi:methylation protein EvaC
MNYCNIGKNIIDYISDSTPAKQGLFSPGKHIPIVSPDVFHNDNVDYALLSAWNHAKEIIEKEREFIKMGGKFIVHVPEVRVLSE